LHIRQAQASDINTLVQWTLKLHSHEDDGVLNAHPNFNHNLENWLSTDIESPASLYLLAELNDQLLGFIGAIQVINDNGFLAQTMKGVIQLLWVEPSARQQGVAVKLLTEAENCFRNLGINYVECTFTTHNQQAKDFWQKMKYKNYSISARKIL